MAEAITLTQEMLNAFISGLNPRKKGEEKSKTDVLKDKISEFVDEIIDTYHIKYVPAKHRIYWYDNGVYRPNGEELIGRLMESKFKGICGNHNVEEAVGMAKRRASFDLDDLIPDPYILNVKNGLYDRRTRILSPHNPEHWSVSQIPVNFDPGVDCPVIKGFFNDIADPADIPLLEEIIGWLLDWWRYRPHKAVMLYGPGRNGKGAFLRLALAFLGKNNCSAVGLQKLVGDRFAPIDLVDKAANISGDLPLKDLSESETFKNATGDDTIRVENKGLQSFNYLNWAKMLFGANKLPETADRTNGFYSRWIIIKFMNIFGPGFKPMDHTIEARMQTPDELSGLLNLALTALDRLEANNWNFSYRLTQQDVKDMYERLSNPVFAFMQDCCSEDQDGYVSKADLLTAYKRYAKEHKLQTYTPRKFAEKVEEQILIPVESGKSCDGFIRVWRGIKMQ